VAFELQRPRLRPFFEKLEKKQEKLEKKQNCQQGELNPGFLLTIRPRNFFLERRKKYESNLLKYCEILSKKTHCTLLLSTKYHCGP
jgi:hypothetical protein